MKSKRTAKELHGWLCEQDQKRRTYRNIAEDLPAFLGVELAPERVAVEVRPEGPVVRMWIDHGEPVVPLSDHLRVSKQNAEASQRVRVALSELRVQHPHPEDGFQHLDNGLLCRTCRAIDVLKGALPAPCGEDGAHGFADFDSDDSR